MASLLPSDLYAGVYKSIVADPQAVRLQREQQARSQAERGELARKQAQQAELEKVLGGVQQGDPQALSRFMQLDPKGAMEYQDAQQKQKDAQAQARTQGLMGLMGLPEDQRATAYPAYRSQLGGAESGLPEQYDPNSLLAMMHTGIKPETQADLRKPPTDSRPADLKEYEFYAQQEAGAGRQPKSFNDWRLESKRAGASTITNVLPGEKAFDSEINKKYAQNFIELQEMGRKAPVSAARLRNAKQAMKASGFYSGPFAESAILPMKQVASVLGFSPGAASNMEAFSADAKNFVLDAIGGSLGTGISDADRSFIEAQAPQLGTTPEGNEKIFDMLIALKEREGKVANLARDYARRNNGRIDFGFDEELAQWAEKNPLFKGGSSSTPKVGRGTVVESGGKKYRVLDDEGNLEAL